MAKKEKALKADPVQQKKAAKHAAPKHTAPKHAAPKHATPKHSTPKHATPKHAAPKPTAPKHTAPVKKATPVPHLTKDQIVEEKLRAQIKQLVAERLADKKHDEAEKAMYMQKLTAYASQVKVDKVLNDEEKALVNEYKRQMQIVEKQRDEVEKGLSGDMRVIAKDAADELAEKKKIAALKDAVAKKLEQMKAHDQAQEKRDVSAAQAADKAVFEAKVNRAVAAALAKANKSSHD